MIVLLQQLVRSRRLRRVGDNVHDKEILVEYHPHNLAVPTMDKIQTTELQHEVNASSWWTELNRFLTSAPSRCVS
jgi:hypothetical protein